MSVSAVRDAHGAVVLVVEDETTRCAVAEHLREAGYIVVETASGEEAPSLCASLICQSTLYSPISN